jgi:hypothetical protein
MHSRSKRLVAGAINPRARALDADGRIRATSLSLSWCSAKAKAMMERQLRCLGEPHLPFLVHQGQGEALLRLRLKKSEQAVAQDEEKQKG